MVDSGAAASACPVDYDLHDSLTTYTTTITTTIHYCYDLLLLLFITATIYYCYHDYDYDYYHYQTDGASDRRHSRPLWPQDHIEQGQDSRRG